MVPSFAVTAPAFSASPVTSTCAVLPLALTAAVFVTHRFVGSPSTCAIDPAGSVTPAPRSTVRVTVPLRAGSRSVPVIPQSASRPAKDAPPGTRER